MNKAKCSICGDIATVLHTGSEDWVKLLCETCFEKNKEFSINFGLTEILDINGDPVMFYIQQEGQDLTKEEREKANKEWIKNIKKLSADLIKDGIITESGEMTEKGYKISGIIPGTDGMQSNMQTNDCDDGE